MSEFNGAKRLLGDQREHYEQFIKAAIDYSNIKAKAWTMKPFGNFADYCDHMYRALDAIQVMNLPSGSRVLEIGSGPGWVTEILMASYYYVDAIEPSERFIECAKQRIKSFSNHLNARIDENVNIKCSTIEDFDVPAEMYDAVLFFDVLHHVVDEEKALYKSFRALKKGGIICIHEGAWNPMDESIRAILEKEVRDYGALENPFTTEYLDYILHNSGFRYIKRYYSIGKPLSFASVSGPHRFVREEDMNFVVAQKPYGFLTTRDEDAIINGTLEVINREFDDGLLRVDVLLKNTGESIWLANHMMGVGYITVALFNKHTRKEMGRKNISRNIYPKEEEIMQLDYIIEPSTFSISDWCLDLVNEQVSWFGLDVSLT